MSVSDKFRDSIAFARCVVREDWEGVESLLALNDDPMDLLVPQSWMLGSAVLRIADMSGVSVDEVWGAMLQSVEQVAPKYDEKDEDES